MPAEPTRESKSIKDFVESADRPQVPPEFILYTTRQVASLLEVGMDTVQDWFRDGTIAGAFQLSDSRWRISQTDLRAFIESHYGT